MNIRIEEINGRTIKDVNKADGLFVVDSKLNLSLKENEISYVLEELPAFEKRCENISKDFSKYVNNDNKSIYLAYVDKKVVGQVVLMKNWNNYGYIEDIRVDLNNRREGIGKMLMCFARDWASAKNLHGVMVETENNNSRACKFFESCGFKIGGFNKMIYKGINAKKDEAALYWYYEFKDNL